jgi:hemerythrin-like metal-binding protein
MASVSKVVQWSDSYSLGLPEIDDQHKTLIDLMNDLWAAIAANAPIEDNQKILLRLEQYTVAHFGAEETMMRTMGYPDFEAHRAAHQGFVKRLQAEGERLQKGERLNLDILHFLRDWLVNHILVSDKAYAAYLAAANKPAGFLGRFFSRFMHA